jgi:universal stress protein E
MRNIKHILVAIKDPSAFTSTALDKAIQVARALGASLELFHSITTSVSLGLDLGMDQLEDFKKARLAQYRNELEVLAERCRDAGVSTMTSVEWDYPPHEAVVRKAMKTEADLIIADVHAGRRVAPLLLHVTDWELLRYSPIPVLLVKNRRPYNKPVMLAAVDPTHANAKPSRLDDEILGTAGVIKRGFRGALHVVHCYVPLPDDVKPAELLSEQATATLEKRARAHARTRLAKVLKHVRIGRGQRHLVSAHPVNAIPTLARKIHCDIVVMGAVSRTGFKRLLIGNTAERIIDDLSCDVLVVKPRDFTTEVRRQSRGVRVRTPPLPMPYFPGPY